MFRLIVLLLVILGLSGCADESSKLELYTLHGKTMGTTYNISLVSAAGVRLDKASIQSKIDEELSLINQVMSTYLKNSEISLFNRAPAGAEIELSLPTREVIQASIELSTATNGAFNVTVGPLVDAWGFGGNSTQSRKVVPEDELRIAMEKVGMDKFSLVASGLSKHSAVEIDLSAIAKGYAVDRIAVLLKSFGVGNYLVEVGGEVRTSGVSIRNSKWVLGVESPDKKGRNVYTRVHLGSAALATSGDYRNYFEVDGVRYSHTIDPRTGFPVSHHLASVSVVAENCMMADAYATALMVMGEDVGFKFAEKHGISAYFIYRKGPRLLTKHTSAFGQYLN